MISPEESEDVEFRIIIEGWSMYELEDDTLLRARAILIRALKPTGAVKKGEPVPLGFSFHQVSSISSPKSLQGTRNPRPKTVDELRSLPQEEVEFQALGETWNVYAIPVLGPDKGLKTRVVVSSVRRVKGEYDAEGNPNYLVDSTIIVTPTKIKEHKLP